MPRIYMHAHHCAYIYIHTMQLVVYGETKPGNASRVETKEYGQYKNSCRLVKRVLLTL